MERENSVHGGQQAMISKYKGGKHFQYCHAVISTVMVGLYRGSISTENTRYPMAAKVAPTEPVPEKRSSTFLTLGGRGTDWVLKTRF